MRCHNNLARTDKVCQIAVVSFKKLFACKSQKFYKVFGYNIKFKRFFKACAKQGAGQIFEQAHHCIGLPVSLFLLLLYSCNICEICMKNRAFVAVIALNCRVHFNPNKFVLVAVDSYLYINRLFGCHRVADCLKNKASVVGINQLVKAINLVFVVFLCSVKKAAAGTV